MDAEYDFGGSSVVDDIPLGPLQIALFAICSLIAMIDGFDTVAVGFVVLDLAKLWNVPLASFGVVFGAGLLGAMLGAMAAGALADRFGRKPSLLASLLIFGVASLAILLTTSLNELIVLRVVVGLGLGGALPGTIALASEYAPRRYRATLTSAIFCGFPFGISVGAAVSAWLLPAYGWQSIFVVGGMVPLVLIPAVALIVPESLSVLRKRGDSQALVAIAKRLGCPGAALLNQPDLSDRKPTIGLVRPLFAEGRAIGTLLLWAAFFLSLMVSYFLVS